MNNTLKEIGGFIARLTSRKFLLTVGGIVAITLFPENSVAICTLIATFVGAEGVADTVSRYAVEKTAAQVKTTAIEQGVQTIDDDVDTSKVVPGTAAASDYPM